MRVRRIREMSEVELTEQLGELRRELFQAGFRKGQDEVEERGRTKKVRRDVARVLTILRERELVSQDAGSPGSGTSAGEES